MAIPLLVLHYMPRADSHEPAPLKFLGRAAGTAFQTLFDNVYDAIFIHALDGRILAVNGKMLRLYQVSAEEALSYSIAEDYSSKDNPLDQLPEIWRKVISGENQFFEWQARRPHDGSTFDVQVFLCRLTLAGSDVILANVHDVTMAKLKERELQAALRARDEFLSMASHELKTPLTSLRMQIDLLERKLRQETSALPAWAENLFPGIKRSLARFTGLIEDFLDISRMESGKFALHFSDADLLQIIRDIHDRMIPALREAGCEIHVDCPESIHGVWDSARLEQVLSNLLSNAVKYAPGSTVTIKAKQMGQLARIEVEDQGPGISQEHRSAIFEKFTRGDAPESTSGLGLGLFIVREIIEDHGGKVTIEQPQSGGSRFVIDLPIRPNRPSRE